MANDLRVAKLSLLHLAWATFYFLILRLVHSFLSEPLSKLFKVNTLALQICFAAHCVGKHFELPVVFKPNVISFQLLGYRSVG